MAQRSSSLSVLEGQQFFRIKQRVATNGVSISVDTSAASISVGPDSDYFCYGVYYFDPTEQLTVKLATINPDRPFFGRLNASLDRRQMMPPELVMKTVSNADTEARARLVVVPEDGFDRVAFTAEIPDGTLKGFLDPRVDIIVANTERIPVVENRSEARLDFALNIPDGGGANLVTFYYIPCYGRRQWTITGGFRDKGGGAAPAPTPELRVVGLRATNNDQAFFDSILSSTPINATTLLNYIADDPGNDGPFDYLELRVSFDAGFPGSDPEDFDSGGYRLIVSLKD